MSTNFTRIKIALRFVALVALLGANLAATPQAIFCTECADCWPEGEGPPEGCCYVSPIGHPICLPRGTNCWVQPGHCAPEI